MTDRFSPRPGELRAAPPKDFDAGLYFIGRIRTPWKSLDECPKNSGEADAVCTIELDALYAPALKDVETCTHLLVLYWMSEAPRDLIVQAPKHYGSPHGTFALRSPARPNPIALSVAQLLGLEGATLRVRGIDCLDGTPLLDLKPYFASTDSKPDARVGWHAKR
jgi:tRNA-Thr(GGU) m(6)t(6)A37 methyltransferase TsaA